LNPGRRAKTTIVAGFFVLVSFFTTPSLWGANLKLVDTPLSHIIELYSKQTGKNVFLDETIQRHRKVTAHLPNMGIEKAFDVVKTIMGLQSCKIGDNGVLLYPPERAKLYRLGMKTTLIKAPSGADSRWVTTLFNQVAPNVNVTFVPEDKETLLLFGPDEQVENAQALAKKFPEIAIEERLIQMREAEAKLAVMEIRDPGVKTEATTSGLICRGRKDVVANYVRRLLHWQQVTGWGSEIYTPKFLTVQEALKAAQASGGRAFVTDLGGTGSFLIEGPIKAHLQLLSILRTIDDRARPYREEVALGEMNRETAQKAIHGSGVKVEGFGQNNIVLVGTAGAVRNTADVLEALGRKKQQVLIQFKLAEVSQGKLKNLGINLDKGTYTHSEIKTFHPNDVLPLLLQVLEEGKYGKILAQPNIRVLEGEEAKITIGDRIPLEVAATAQTDSGSTLKLNTQLTWVDVGIKMTINDVRINQDNSVRMGLKAEVSSVVGTTQQGYPQIRTREAESILRVQDGGSVVLGGLISQEKRKQRNRFPILSRIPLVGWLMNSNRKDSTSSEIIMIVTAKLVFD